MFFIPQINFTWLYYFVKCDLLSTVHLKMNNLRPGEIIQWIRVFAKKNPRDSEFKSLELSWKTGHCLVFLFHRVGGEKYEDPGNALARQSSRNSEIQVQWEALSQQITSLYVHIPKCNLASLFNVTSMYVSGLTIWCWINNRCVLPWERLFIQLISKNN